MSRERILAAVREALSGNGKDRARHRSVAERLAQPPLHPSGAGAPPEQQVEIAARFKTNLQRLGANPIEVAREDEIPSAIANYLAALGLPLRMRRGSDGPLASLQWETAPALTVDTGPAEPDDTVGLSHAVAGVAETGTLVLASGPDSPVTLALLPETHIVVLSADAIVYRYEEALAMVLTSCGGRLPRTVNLVTGASRTGDIGGKIVMGAHGPRRLAVVIYGAGAAAAAAAVR